MLDEAILGRLPLGTVVNEKYEIQKVIGSGGFGTTYLAQDLVLKMPVAVKEYKKQSYVSEKKRNRDFWRKPEPWPGLPVIRVL